MDNLLLERFHIGPQPLTNLLQGLAERFQRLQPLSLFFLPP